MIAGSHGRIPKWSSGWCNFGVDFKVIYRQTKSSSDPSHNHQLDQKMAAMYMYKRQVATIHIYKPTNTKHQYTTHIIHIHLYTYIQQPIPHISVFPIDSPHINGPPSTVVLAQIPTWQRNAGGGGVNATAALPQWVVSKQARVKCQWWGHVMVVVSAMDIIMVDNIQVNNTNMI